LLIVFIGDLFYQLHILYTAKQQNMHGRDGKSDGVIAISFYILCDRLSTYSPTIRDHFICDTGRLVS